MITRKQYMQSSSDLHREYYSQFITPATIQFVKTEIGMDKLRLSTDKHLNDVEVERYPEGRWQWDLTPVNTVLVAKAEERLIKHASDSCRTCVGKEAARILLKEEGITSGILGIK